jgi:hypothetical protein
MTIISYLTFVLLLTIIVEGMIYWVFIRKNLLYLVLVSVLINTFTLPLATYAYYFMYTNIYFIELVVIIGESVLLFFLLRVKYSQSVVLSLSANVITSLLSFFV